MKDYFDNLQEKVDSIEQEEALLQGTTEWQEQRLGKLTSSRFGDMMQRGRGKSEDFGLKAMTYVYEKIAEQLTGSAHLITSKAMEWGLEMEDEAREQYSLISKNYVDPCGFIRFSEVAGGTPDGLVGEDGIIEIKCPYNPANHIETVIGNLVPDRYHMQIQGNLMVTGRNWCDYISYDPRITEEVLKMHVIRVGRDEEIIEAIGERIKVVSELIKELIKKVK